MENITLGQIATIITFLVALIGGITSLIAFSRNFIKKILNPLKKEIQEIQEIAATSRNNMEIELIKVILANFINDVDQGIKKSQIQKQNAFELYDRYLSLGGNSYIHENWKKLIKENKI